MATASAAITTVIAQRVFRVHLVLTPLLPDVPSPDTHNETLSCCRLARKDAIRTRKTVS